MLARRPVFAALGLATFAVAFLFSSPGFATCDIRKTWSRYEHDRMSLESFFESCGRSIEETRGEARNALLKPYREWKEKKRREEEARIARERAAVEEIRRKEREDFRRVLDAEKAKLETMKREAAEAERKREAARLKMKYEEEMRELRRFEKREGLTPEKPKPPTPPLGSTGERAPGGIRLGVQPTGSNADLSDVRSRVLNLPR
ncbi:MAG: hypothetical protein M5U33_00780 [Pseudorhodoplanes sp.]|nr:hypothetical protein [Pseudorhodoplanes sp.]